MAIPLSDEGPPLEGEEEDQFTDEPLDPFVRDNLEVDCIIDGQRYLTRELEVHLTDGSATNYATGIVIAQKDGDGPEVGDKIAIEVDNKLTEIRPNTSEITRLFTGVISNRSRIKNLGAFEFMAFWPGFNEIQNGKVGINYTPPRIQDFSVKDAGTVPLKVNYTKSHQLASDIAEQVAETITAGTDFGFDIFISGDGERINGQRYAQDIKLWIRSAQVPITADGSDEGLLQRVTRATNTVWEVDRYGNFYIGPPRPNGNIPTSVQSHKLRYITETTAGKQSPAWRSIKVIGDGVVSKDGWASSAQVNEEKQLLSSPIARRTDAQPKDVELAEPTFVYTNLEIKTADEAENVLTQIREDIRKQNAGGEITVVGHPELWPGDAIELPDTEKQPFSNERYAIGKVIHRINNSDGFLTKIEVMGETNAANSVWSDEVNQNKYYDAFYTDEELRRIEEGRRGL